MKQIIYTNKQGYSETHIFDNSGYFLAFSVHKQFDNDLWMCEQGGSFNPAKGSLGLL